MCLPQPDVNVKTRKAVFKAKPYEGVMGSIQS